MAITPQLELQVLSGNAKVFYQSHAYGTTNFIPVPENKSIVITALDVFRSLNDPQIIQEYNTDGGAPPNANFLQGNYMLDFPPVNTQSLTSLMNNGITYQVEIYSKDNVSTFTYAMKLVPVSITQDNGIAPKTYRIVYVPTSITEHKDIYSVHKNPVYIRLKLRIKTAIVVQWMKNFLFSNNPAFDKTYDIDSIFSVYRNQANDVNPDLSWQTADVLVFDFANIQTETGTIQNYTPFTGNFEFSDDDPSTPFTTQTYRWGIPNDDLTSPGNLSGYDTGGVAVPGGEAVAAPLILSQAVGKMMDAFFPFINVEYVLLNYAVGDNAVIPADNLIY
jgi:hypothetical protein